MKISQKDRFYGQALSQIVEHPTFKALNKLNGKTGHYVLATSKDHINRTILIKYSSVAGSKWTFTLSEHDIEALKDDMARAEKTCKPFLVLVCADYTICQLSQDQICSVIDPSTPTQQWISVESRNNGSLRVRGSAGSLLRTIPHNSFPERLLA